MTREPCVVVPDYDEASTLLIGTVVFAVYGCEHWEVSVGMLRGYVEISLGCEFKERIKMGKNMYPGEEDKYYSQGPVPPYQSTAYFSVVVSSTSASTTTTSKRGPYPCRPDPYSRSSRPRLNHIRGHKQFTTPHPLLHNYIQH